MNDSENPQFEVHDREVLEKAQVDPQQNRIPPHVGAGSDRCGQEK